MNYRGILFFLGANSLIVSFFSFLNILYSIYFNFFSDINSYTITLFISMLVGVLFCTIGYKHIKNIHLSDQILLIVFTFLFVPLLISIPYFLSIYDISLLNSYFESVSGFTTTGFSIIENINEIDEPLLLWRSSSQWLGGLFFLIAIFGTLGNKQVKIKPNYLITETGFAGNFVYNFIKIALIYFILTVVVISLFNFSNLRLLDSFNLSFTTISTGGFLPTNNLANIIFSEAQILVLSISLLFPIFNFYLLFKILTMKFKLEDHHEDLHLALTIILLTLIFYFLINSDENFIKAFLSVISSISNSGIILHSFDFDASLFFILITIIGGSLASTTSGFKYIRFYVLLKISYHEIYRLVKPINIFNRNLFRSNYQIKDEDVKITFLIFISFIIAIFVLSSVLTLDNLNFEDSFKLSILTLTNTTASELYGIKNLSFLDLNSFTKITLITFMIFGKVEIIAILFLFKKFIFRE